MSIKERVVQELGSLSESELRQVADYVAFLKFQAQIKPLSELNEKQLAALYAEFADEDRELAEEGMQDLRHETSDSCLTSQVSRLMSEV